MRTTRGPIAFPLRLLGTVYVDVFRGLPLLLVIFLLGFGGPALNLSGLPRSALFWGCAALVLSYSAYVAEVFRAGIESVHPSQRLAGRALGLSYAQTLRHVVLPQAWRRVLPPLMNDLVSLQKDSGLIAVLGGHRCDPGGADRDGEGLQLHAVRRRRLAVHLPDHADGAADGLVRAQAGLPRRREA